MYSINLVPASSASLSSNSCHKSSFSLVYRWLVYGHCNQENSR